MRTERGQALTELVAGLLAAALVFSALFAFAAYILAGLDAQRETRAEAGKGALGSVGGSGSYSSASRSETISVPSMAADRIFGSDSVTVRDEVHIPAAGIAQ